MAQTPTSQSGADSLQAILNVVNILHKLLSIQIIINDDFAHIRLVIGRLVAVLAGNELVLKELTYVFSHA